MARKTRKASRRLAPRIPTFASTNVSISHWYKKVFDRLGWTVLAAAQGYNYRVTAYKKSVENLLKTIDHVAAEYEDHNRLHDLKVMKMHVEVLHDYVEKHL